MTEHHDAVPYARYAVLLRAVNVGGRRVKMAQLREALSAAGFADPKTLLASGNVVLRVPPEDLMTLAPRVEAVIEEHFGLHSDVIVRDNEALASVASAHPFRADEENASRLSVVFLRDVPAQARVAAMDADRSPPDRFHVLDREVFLHYPEGSARSKLTLDWLERQLGTIGTGRNLNTVAKLVALTDPALSTDG